MTKELHPSIRAELGHGPEEDGQEILKNWKAITSSICKPCWELKYCPFGPLVEGFPLLPPTRAEAQQHQDYISTCLRTGRTADNSDVTEEQRQYFQELTDHFDPSDYPEEIPPIIADTQCRLYGHLCPVFFTAEPLTETKDMRRKGRHIPREVMLKVVRRDGQVCQECGKNVRDDELQFDHIIPHDKGGPVTVDNLRVLCAECNRTKGSTLEYILDPSPLSKHLFHADQKGHQED